MTRTLLDSIDVSKLSYCEPTHAGPLACWCIRQTTTVGKKHGGGVDTASFCGRVKPGYGWDLEKAVDQDDFDMWTHREGWNDRPVVCQRCVAKLRGEP